MRIKHTKIPGLIALGMAAALLTTACGNGDEPEAAPSPTEAEETPAETEEPTDENGEEEPEEEVAPDRADADLVIWTDDLRGPALEGPAREWGEANGISVAVQAVSGSLQDLFITADSLGNGPDLVIGAHDWVGNLVQNAAIVPVTITNTDDFTDGAIDAMTFEGQLFGMPYAVETTALFANNALTAVPSPATIEELVAAAEAGGASRALCLQVGITGDAYHMQGLFTSAGGYIFGRNDDGSLNPDDVGVDSEGAIAFANKIAELGAAGVLSTSVDGANSQPLFHDGECAYLISGPWAIANVEAAGIDFTISPYPGFEGFGPAMPMSGVQGFFVAANGQNQAFAQQFLQDMASSPDIVLGMFETDQRSPVLRSAIDAIADANPHIAAFGEFSDIAEAMPAIPAMSAVWGPLGQAQAQIIDGADPEATIRAAAEEIRNAIG